MNREDRAFEVELILEKLLDCFTPDDEIETTEGMAKVSPEISELISSAWQLLSSEEDDE